MILHHFLNTTLEQEAHELMHGILPAGIQWRWLGNGILEYIPAQPATTSVVLSAGIHGDETAPVEMLGALISDIAEAKIPLHTRLLVLFGNIAAMRSGQRYLDDDLNRLFSGQHQALPHSREAQRAIELERALGHFFAAADGLRWHIDLHAAIRPSLFERFALLPQHQAGHDMMPWLGTLGIEAVVQHNNSAGTFAHYSSHAHQALACTLELGRAKPFGHNDLASYAGVDKGVRQLLAAERQQARVMPKLFDVVATLNKRSEAFRLCIGGDVRNFTAYPRGTVIAQDGDEQYIVSHVEECILFANPSVKINMRAGLMVVERI